MTAGEHSRSGITWVAIDVAKAANVVLVEDTSGRHLRFRVANSRVDHDRFIRFLRSQPGECRVALEPTGNYHRPLAHRLRTEGVVGVYGISCL
jgi:transposase